MITDSKDTLEHPKLAAAAIRDLIRELAKLRARMTELERKGRQEGMR